MTTRLSDDEPDFTLPLSVFENKDDKHPRRHDLAWHAFAKRLCRYDERLTKDGKAWSPVTYLPGTTRGKANVDQVYALVLDADHSPLPMDLLVQFEMVAHTTYQHTPEAPRWRAILPLSRPISGADWPTFWLRANSYFGGCADPATKDSSRIFYLPSCPPGGVHEVKQQHGRVLDPDELPEVAPYEPPRVQQRGGHKKSVLTTYLAEWAGRFLNERCAGLAGMARDSGRNNECNRLAHLLAGLAIDPVHNLPLEQVVDRVFLACIGNGLVADDGESSVRATIRSGVESGLLRPWSPADQDPLLPARKYEVPKVVTATLHAVPDDELRLDIVRMSDVQVEPIRWLWKGRLARGKLALLMGDPGLGKSLITHWLAARVSVGGDWPDAGQCERAAAIVFTIEDSLSDTVKPRLVAAGADMDRVLSVRGVVNPKASLDEKMFALEEHIGLLEALIVEEGASLVVMDPVSAYLGANVNSHKEADVRRVLGPLSLMAERTGVAVLMVIHLNKGKDIAALNRATGSVAFPAVSRIVLGVVADPTDEDNKRRLLLPLKCNIARMPPGLGYRIESAPTPILPRPGDDDVPPVLVWDNEPSIDDASQAMDRGSVTERNQTEETVVALRQIFASNGYERMLATVVTRLLREAGASTAGSTLTNAKKQLGIRSLMDPQARVWYWHWPKSSVTPRARTSTVESSNEPSPQTGQTDQTLPSSSPTSHSSDSIDSTPSHAPAHARDEMRFCVTCRCNLTLEAYAAHEPCIPEELCPVHHTRFDLHDCDQL